MDADRLLVVAVAAVALVAFGVSAANVAGVVGDDRAPDVDEDSDHGTVEPPDVPAPSDTCLIGCGGVQGLLANLLGGASREVILAVAGVAVAVLAGFWWLTRGRPEEVEDELEAVPTVDAPDVDGGSVSVSAPPDAPASNEVYRAWRELADALDPVEQRSLTPAEYAERARQRGYDEAAVETLTAVFRRVRYGRESVTDEGERRARRAIEDILGEEP